MKKNHISVAIACALLQLGNYSCAAEITEGFDECKNQTSETCFSNITGTVDHLEGNVHRSAAEDGDPEGLHMDVSFGSKSLEVLGDTRLTVVGVNKNAYGISLSGSRNNTLQTIFHDTYLDVTSNGSHGHTTGLWVLSGFKSNTTVPASATIAGNLSVKVSSSWTAKGVVAGSDFGNNSDQLGTVCLKKNNFIEVNMLDMSPKYSNDNR